MDSEERWPDLTCTIITGIIVLIICSPILAAYPVVMSLPIVIGLIGFYYALIKFFGGGFVIEGAVIIIAVLTLLLLPNLYSYQ